MGRPAVKHDNTRVHHLLGGYLCSSELCEEHPAIDDILSGALALKSEGKSSTRALSRKTLFRILQCCPCITVAAANAATQGRYAYSTLAEYAAVARVASKAIEGYLGKLPPLPGEDKTLQQCRRELDAPFLAELEAQGLVQHGSLAASVTAADHDAAAARSALAAFREHLKGRSASASVCA